jgi:hypothetical protein
MSPTVEVHVLRYGDDWLVPYVVRHYLTFASRVVIHDAGGGRSLEDIEGMIPGVSIIHWDCNEVNDLKYAELRNECWKGTKADWVVVGDLDELLWFPGGAEAALRRYEQVGAAVPKPHGIQMFSETYPSGDGQILDEIKMGAPADKWYSKAMLFNPRLVSGMNYGLGSHECDPYLHDGRRFHVGPKWPFAKPECYLLHVHHIGPAEDIAAKYDATITRMCEANKKNHWGNLEPGMKHVVDQRATIVPFLKQVIP